MLHRNTLIGFQSGFKGILKYFAVAVDFAGSVDRLNRGAALTGISDSKLGLISVWVRIDGGDNSERYVLQQKTDRLAVILLNTNIFRIQLTDGTNLQRIHSNTAYTASSTWLHILTSWDRGNDVKHLYIADGDELDPVTLTDHVVDYSTTDFAIGATTTGFALWDGCMSEIWFDTQYLDLSIESNRRLFIDGSGKPVDLGSDGSTPGLGQPLVYMNQNSTSTWHTNAGSGGGFNESGSISDCSDSPSN